MKVPCPHCQQASVITSRNTISNNVSELYCRCNNDGCGASFVMSLAHKHDLVPPQSAFENMMIEFFNQLPGKTKQQLIESLKM